MPASGCIPRARATTRWPPTCGCGCATRSTPLALRVVALERALLEQAAAPRRARHAGLHASAGRAAGHLRPSPARLRRDARARPRTADAGAARGSIGCRSARRRSPGPASRSTAGAWRASSASRASCENSLDAVSDRDFAIEFCACAALDHGAPVAPVRGARAVDEPALRLRAPARPLLHRLLDHAAEEESGRARAGARQERAGDRRHHGAADADEGPAARLQQGQPGGQGAALRRGRHREGLAVGLRRHDRGHGAGAGGDARGGAGGPRDRDRPCRLPGAQRRAVPRRARSGGARGARSRAPAPTSPRCRSTTLRSFSEHIEADVRRVLTPEGSIAARNHIGGTAPAQVRAAAARARKRLRE